MSMKTVSKIEVSDVRVKECATHIHFQQNDPITGALHWITVSKGDLKQLIEYLNKVECQ